VSDAFNKMEQEKQISLRPSNSCRNTSNTYETKVVEPKTKASPFS